VLRIHVDRHGRVSHGFTGLALRDAQVVRTKHVIRQDASNHHLPASATIGDVHDMLCWVSMLVRTAMRALTAMSCSGDTAPREWTIANVYN
jgi:hypothetical protein